MATAFCRLYYALGGAYCGTAALCAHPGAWGGGDVRGWQGGVVAKE